MIREGMDKKDRFEALKEIAEYQLRVLNEAEKSAIGLRNNSIQPFCRHWQMVDIYFGGVII